MSNEKPEALELADIFENLAHPTGTRYRAAAELRRQHARIKELEAMLDAVGAGGVSAQRVTQGKDHIEQPIEMVAAPVVLPEPVARRYKDKITGLHHYGERPTFQEEYQNTEPLYTEQQVRALLAGVSAPAAQAINLLAADHSGMKVDYRGLFSQVQRAIKRSDPVYAEMLRQLEGHLQELGQRWYAGDTNVVDEILQLYCIERDSRKTVRQDAAAAPQPQADARDAQRYRWLIDYFISDRVDLDDAIVAAKTSEDIAKIIDAAIAAAKEKS